MKQLLSIIASFLTLGTAFAGESALIEVYQPLDGAESGLKIVPVSCFVWNIASGQPYSILSISAENHPPTVSAEHPVPNLNIASCCKIGFSGGDANEHDKSIVLEATQIPSGKELSKVCVYEKEKVVRATLECLRRSVTGNLAKFPVTLHCKEEDRKWLEPIVKEYNGADHSKPFFNPGEA